VTYLIAGIVKGERRSYEPLVYWQRMLAQIIVSDQALVPDGKLERAKLVHK